MRRPSLKEMGMGALAALGIIAANELGDKTEAVPPDAHRDEALGVDESKNEAIEALPLSIRKQAKPKTGNIDSPGMGPKPESEDATTPEIEAAKILDRVMDILRAKFPNLREDYFSEKDDLTRANVEDILSMVDHTTRDQQLCKREESLAQSYGVGFSYPDADDPPEATPALMLAHGDIRNNSNWSKKIENECKLFGQAPVEFSVRITPNVGDGSVDIYLSGLVVHGVNVEDVPEVFTLAEDVYTKRYLSLENGVEEQRYRSEMVNMLKFFGSVIDF